MKQAEFHARGVHVYRDLSVDLATHRQFEEWAERLGTNPSHLVHHVLRYLAHEPSAQGDRVVRRAENWYMETIARPESERLGQTIFSPNRPPLDMRD